MNSTPSASRRPVYAEPVDDGRLVPPRWLESAPVTSAILALNVGVFLVEVVVGHATSDLPSGPALALGASYSLATVGEWRLETLVTACFLHAGFLHLAFNMLALWQAGPLVERAVGPARMAPMYLFAGALGNALSVGVGVVTGAAQLTVGASGAIAGVIAAALVLGWRTEGWRHPLTQAMARWLGFVVAFGLLSNLVGGHIDNAAHVGGALAGGLVALLWKRGGRYPARATALVLAGCVAVVLGCIGRVALRDRSDRFATMTLPARVEYTNDALADDRCEDARAGMSAIERLRGPKTTVMAGPLRGGARWGSGWGSGGDPVRALHDAVDEACNRAPAH